MTIQLIAIDLDGTLLSGHTYINETNKAAIRAAQAAGIVVAIATGREHNNVRSFLETAELVTPVISSNGSVIHDEQKQPMFSLPLARHQALEVLDWLEKNDYYYQVHTSRGIYTISTGHQLLAVEIDRLLSTNPDPSYLQMLEAMQSMSAKLKMIRVHTYHEIPDHTDFYNILALSFEQDKLEVGRKHFDGREDITMVVSGHMNFEIEHKHASKGTALQHLAAHYNIPLEQTMAIGDNFNDISMIQLAGLGVAMGNAELEVKAIADEITLTNEQDGVAHAIYKALGMNVPLV
ncbi:HAD family hydrolase [Paenibacillus campi]|uniref:HAD family hydrolase n=1 Tax=Paenibacillus campi TaxID=3106031 RepID=UPI002B001266|nr:HAD family hydrolase [Paenibacillus sp. SGZ-1009]